MMRGYRLIAILLLAAAPSFASALSYTLTPSAVQAVAGGTVLLGGTLQNTGAADLFLNDFSVQFDPPAGAYLSADPNYFFENVPGVLSAGEQYTGNIFELFVSPDAPPGTFTGSGTIYGGLDAFANDNLGIRTFTVILATPEPAAAFLLATGLAAIEIYRRRAAK
ncbi:MAG: hypothetical protein M3N54_13475 [Acidobacteriota bacterium]|nr:hypothetical protein [Acidobacteriota bacterium]